MSNDKKADHVIDQQILSEMGENMQAQTIPEAQRDRLRNRVMHFAQKNPKQNKNPLFIVRAEQGQWEYLQPGVTIKVLNHNQKTGFVTAIWKAEPGATFEAHPHFDEEECLVLDGEIKIEDQILVQGDYLLGQSGIDHSEIHTPGGALLLIRAPLHEYQETRS